MKVCPTCGAKVTTWRPFTKEDQLANLTARDVVGPSGPDLIAAHHDPSTHRPCPASGGEWSEIAPLGD